MTQNSHGRIYFRPDMKRAILEGRKTKTSRTKKHALGLWEAYSSGKRFAWIRITDIVATNWLNVTMNEFAAEGFESPEQMREWAVDMGLGHYSLAKTLYCHTFEVAT